MNSNIAEDICLNPNITIGALIELSKNKYWRIRQAVAKHIKTPIEILEKLSKDEDWRVRLHIIFNSNSPLEVLIELSKDEIVPISEVAKQARINRISLLK